MSTKNVVRAIQVGVLVGAGLCAVPVLKQAGETAIRFCCTPQQSAACAAPGRHGELSHERLSVPVLIEAPGVRATGT